MEPQNTQNTQMDTGEDRVNVLSKRIIGCALTVLHALGAGFLEKVYETGCGRGIDLLVEHIVLVELKVTKAIDEIHRAQCLNYLKATGLHLCLLFNFDKPRLKIKRIVLAS
jgi:hypothetical protein